MKRAEDLNLKSLVYRFDLIFAFSVLKVKVENEKAGLNLNIQKMKIVASGPITS